MPDGLKKVYEYKKNFDGNEVTQCTELLLTIKKKKNI